MEDKWEKLRQIVREENERLKTELLAAISKNKAPNRNKAPQPKIENGRLTGVTEEQMNAWKAAYPGVDLNAEINRAVAWIVSNPTLAPKQIRRFLNSWFTKEQNRRAIRSIPDVRSISAKVCRYCGKPATGAVNGYDACERHFQNALDNEKPLPLQHANPL